MPLPISKDPSQIPEAKSHQQAAITEPGYGYPDSSQQQSPHAASPSSPQAPAPTTRHTGNPPVPCLGRSLLIQNVSRGRMPSNESPTVPPGGRFWHGFAVRRPPVGGGGRGVGKSEADTFCDLATSHPMQSGGWQDSTFRKPCRMRGTSTWITFCRLSRSRRSAGSLAGRSTGPSRGASCERRSCATDSASFQRRSSDGLRRGLSRPSPRFRSPPCTGGVSLRRAEASERSWRGRRATGESS